MSHLEPIGPIVALAECESESECQFGIWIMYVSFSTCDCDSLNQDVNLNFTWTETSQGHSCHQKKEKLSTWKESRNKQGKNMDTGPGPLSLAPGRAPCSLFFILQEEKQPVNVNVNLSSNTKTQHIIFNPVHKKEKHQLQLQNHKRVSEMTFVEKIVWLIGNKSQILISLCQFSTYHRKCSTI